MKKIYNVSFNDASSIRLISKNYSFECYSNEYVSNLFRDLSLKEGDTVQIIINNDDDNDDDYTWEWVYNEKNQTSSLKCLVSDCLMYDIIYSIFDDRSFASAEESLKKSMYWRKNDKIKPREKIRPNLKQHFKKHGFQLNDDGSLKKIDGYESFIDIFLNLEKANLIMSIIKSYAEEYPDLYEKEMKKFNLEIK